VGVLLVVGEPHDRIADQLAGTVVRDVAAAADFVELEAARGEGAGVEQRVLVVRVAAKGEHLGMLEQDEGVDALVPLPQRDELVLPRLHHPEGPAPALRARASSVVDPHPVGPPLRPGDPAP